jgi:hypothetical protein
MSIIPRCPPLEAAPGTVMETEMHTSCETCEPRMLGVMSAATALQLLQQGAAKLLGFPYVPSFAELKILLLVGVASVLERVGGGSTASGRRTMR